MNNPLVSICMITYNHEDYIRDAIEGVLMQKTDFPIELIIGEDCSTDNTRKIVNEYEAKYPEIIVAQYPETNRGMMNNFIAVLETARGKYIALCEGDDYWTDPYKLQKQVNFLKSNKEYIFCYHKVEVIGDDRKYYIGKNKDSAIRFSESIISKGGATLSLVIKKGEYLKSYYQLISKLNLNIADWPLEVILSSYGKGYYLSELMGCYRVHDNGATQGLSLRVYFNDRVTFLELFQECKELSKKDKNLVKAVLSRAYLSRALIQLFNTAFLKDLKGFTFYLPYYLLNLRRIKFNEFYKVKYALSYRLRR